MPVQGGRPGAPTLWLAGLLAQQAEAANVGSLATSGLAEHEGEEQPTCAPAARPRRGGHGPREKNLLAKRSL